MFTGKTRGIAFAIKIVGRHARLTGSIRRTRPQYEPAESMPVTHTRNVDTSPGVRDAKTAPPARGRKRQMNLHYALCAAKIPPKRGE